MIMKRFFTILTLALLTVATAVAAYRVEDIENVQLRDATRYTTNPDGILSQEAVQSIDAVCRSLKERGIAEVAVVAVKDIDSGSVFDFGIELFERWGVGNDELDNGLGVLLVEDEHEIRFFTGYGIEGVLTDALSVRIQQEYMLPHFRQGDYSVGMVAGIEAVDTLLTNGDLPQATNNDGEEHLLALMIVLCFVLLPLLLVLAAQQKETKCPNCGKHGLRVVDSRVLANTAFSTTTRQMLVCDKCGSEHTRTIKRDKPGSRGGGPIIFGGGGFGGGFGGGSFGGGSFGGGGGGSSW